MAMAILVISDIARNLLRGDKRGSLGDRNPPAGSTAEPQWECGGKAPRTLPPEAGDTC